MSDAENKNKLRITPIRTKIPPDHPFEIVKDELISTVAQYIHSDSHLTTFFVAYLDYGVRIGCYEKNQFVLSENEPLVPDYFQRLRVFDRKKELLLWRTTKGFQGRLREDEIDNAEFVDMIEVQQVLFGTRAKPLDTKNFTEIREDRGTRLILPFQDLNVDTQQQRIWIKTRNYIDYIEKTGQATYTDCRFVSFTDGVKDL